MTTQTRVIVNRAVDPPHRYELLAEIGQGGMAVVYRARDLDPSPKWLQANGDAPRIVAVKYPHRNMVLEKKEIVDRFIREATIVKAIRHPNIITIHALGIDDEDQPFMVMEFIDGASTLADVINGYRDVFYANPVRPSKIRGSLVPVEVIVPILCRVCDALSVLHARQIVHRDVKPENILLTLEANEYRPYIMDFGIAKSLDKSQPDQDLTKGTVVGTPFYLSPEHIWHEQKHPVTDHLWGLGPWSDNWSLGVILYEMMSGQLPFYDSNPFGTLTKIAKDDPTPIATYVEEPYPLLLDLLNGLLKKLPWDRIESVEEVKRRLEAIRSSQKISDLVTASLIHAPVNRNAITLPGDVVVLEAPKPELRPSRRPTMQSTFDADKPARPVRRILFAVAALLAIVSAVLVWNARPRPSGHVPAARAPSASAQEPRAVPPMASNAAETTSAPPAEPPAESPQAKPAKRAPGPGPTRDNQETFRLYQRGVDAAARGDCRTVEMIMNGILVQYPSFPAPLKFLGDCARKRGNPAKARQYYERYLAFEGVPSLPPDAKAILR